MIPQAKNSTTELILVQMPYQKYRPPPILARRCALWQMVLNVRLRNHENSENGEKLSLDLIFINNCWQNISCFCKQNSIQRIYSKPSEFIQTGQKFTRSFSVHFLVLQTEHKEQTGYDAYLCSVPLSYPSTGCFILICYTYFEVQDSTMVSLYRRDPHKFIFIQIWKLLPPFIWTWP